MATYSAMRGATPRKTRGRGPSKPGLDPLYDRSKFVADVLWERAVELARVMAPEVPADSEALPEYDQWQILEAAAAAFSPGYWDDPEALEDLYRYRKQYLGTEDEQLKALAGVAKERAKALPDPSITPQNPEFERIAKRLGVR